MSGALSKLETRIANLEKASEELREQTREANATLKQLRLVKKEIAELLDSTPQKLVTDAVNEGLAKFSDELREHTTRSHKAVEREFDKLADIFVSGVDKGRDHILVEAHAARMRRKAELKWEEATRD